MSTPVLSVVTITKDDPNGFARTLTSMAAWQRLSWVEHIVVFAGKAVPLEATDHITILRQTSSGITLAFNEGLNHARGDWVWFVNGGDAIHETLDPSWLLMLLQKTSADVVSGALENDGDPELRVAPPLWLQWPPLVSWLPHPATLVRTTALKKVGGFDPRWKICADYDLWFRLLSKSTVVDLVAMPFARFDRSGISQRADARALLKRENAKVLWRHRATILRSLGRILRGVLSTLRRCV